ncbi:MAG TPA: DNA mismatch repair protein MutS [Clostridiaceae bacterium]|nr:DNA mismatch repair protein MutS [Clostridiaceae bacterium]
MAYKSILYPEIRTDDVQNITEAPDYFSDLNLDQIIDYITAKRDEFDLKPLFYTALHSEDEILYRQEVMHDLEDQAMFDCIKDFAKCINMISAKMSTVSKNLSQPESYHCNYLEKGRLLDSADTYCAVVNNLVHNIADFELLSRGLLAFREYVVDYAKSDSFLSLQSETREMRNALATVHYCMLIKDGSIKVRKYDNEIDYTPEIESIFQRFRQGVTKDYRQKLFEEPYAEHVEAEVLNLVSRIYPDIFSALNDYCTKNMDFIDQAISLFSRDVQFYIAYIEYIKKFERVGLKFCYPRICSTSKEIFNRGGFDLALAGNLISQNKVVVCNDFYLKGKERIIVVTGPNQGGKTTFARVFGQLHHFASLGCPVAGREAQLFMFDRIFTHFEREENIKNLNGKLQDDLIRIHDILIHATKDSIIIMNEILSSTTLKDAIFIGKKLMDKIIHLESLCVYVTFLDELASYDETVVSMVSTVVPEDPAQRTYKIIRSPANGLAYAINIAQKYRLTYDCLKERIKDESTSDVS